MLIAQWDARQQAVKMPKGYQQVFDGDPSDAGHKPKRGQTVILSYARTVASSACWRSTSPPRRPRPSRRRRMPRRALSPSPPDRRCGRRAGRSFLPAPVADISPVTKAGRDMIAAARPRPRRRPSRAARADGRPDSRTWRDLCALLVVAAHAENVTIGGYAGSSFPPPSGAAGGDLVARIITPRATSPPPTRISSPSHFAFWSAR